MNADELLEWANDDPALRRPADAVVALMRSDWERSTDPGFCVGCPKCGTDYIMRDCAIERVGGVGCSDCFGDRDRPPFGAVGETWPDRGLVSASLGWCACADPVEIDELMERYLVSRAAAHVSGASTLTITGGGESADLLLAYIADRAGWTEHGGSVAGAWLTERGQAVLKRLDDALNRRWLVLEFDGLIRGRVSLPTSERWLDADVRSLTGLMASFIVQPEQAVWSVVTDRPTW